MSTKTKNKKKDRLNVRFSYNKAKLTADSLITSFIWEDTKEGLKYWKKVYDRLIEISKIGKQK